MERAKQNEAGKFSTASKHGGASAQRAVEDRQVTLDASYWDEKRRDGSYWDEKRSISKEKIE